MIRRPTAVLGALVLAGGISLASALPVGAQTDGPAPGVVYSARKGSARVRLVGLGESPNGESLVLVDVKVECERFEPEGRLVGVVEEEGRFEVQGAATESGTTDVITGEFDDIDGKVRSDGAVLEIDVEIEGADNAGSTGRCEDTQQWRLEPRTSAGARRVDGAVPTEAEVLATNGDALFTLRTGERRGELARVDPATLATTWTVDVPADVSTIAAAADAVWLVDGGSLELIRIGALSGDVEATIPLEATEVGQRLDFVLPGVVASPIAAWVAIDETESMYRVDAASNETTIGTVPGRVDALAAVADGVVASTVAAPGGDARLVRFGGQTDELQAMPIEDLPSAIGSDTGLVWTRSTDRLAAYDATTVQFSGQLSHRRLATSSFTDLVLALQPGAWTPTTRGLEAFAADFTRAIDIPIVGAAATGLVAAQGAVFVIDSGYVIRVDAG